jgi:hypothetical protein
MRIKIRFLTSFFSLFAYDKEDEEVLFQNVYCHVVPDILKLVISTNQ